MGNITTSFTTSFLNHGRMLVPWFLQIPIPRIPGGCHLWLEGLREPPLLEIPQVITGMAGCLFPLKFSKHVGKTAWLTTHTCMHIYMYIYTYIYIYTHCLRLMYVLQIYLIDSHLLIFTYYTKDPSCLQI